MSFEPDSLGGTGAEDVQRAEFLRRYFDIAQTEYEAFAPVLAARIEAVAARKPEGPLTFLDVGCGQGHLLEATLRLLAPTTRDRVRIDYLDPQEENLTRYRARLPDERLGRPIQSRFEDFYGSGPGERYSLILAFQSLYSYDTVAHGSALKGFRDLLAEGGRGLIVHGNPDSFYFTFAELARQGGFEPRPEEFTGLGDIQTALERAGVVAESTVVPFTQVIPMSERENLLVYLAAGLYLVDTGPVRSQWSWVSNAIGSYLRGEQYEFPQDLALLEISR